jgi:Holliday junction resolvase RusA-like endonuclease
MVINFWVPISVKPKGNSKRSFNGHVVSDKKQVANANTLESLCLPHRPSRPLEGPLTVSYRFQDRWRAPDQKRREKGKLPDWMPRSTGKDLGNCTKQMDDVLEKCGFFLNDSQIWNYGGTCKVWADEPGVHVRIESP